jgi:hypothetical protein
VDDTKLIFNKGHRSRSSVIRPALPLSAGAILQDSRGAPGFNPTRAFAGIGSLAVFLSGGAPPPPRHGPFIAVAYPPPAHSRLGCSPKCGLNAAYHTTSCRYRSNTNQCLDKKSGGRPGFRPTVPLNLSCSPVSAALPPVPETAARRWPGVSCNHNFPQRSIQEKD